MEVNLTLGWGLRSPGGNGESEDTKAAMLVLLFLVCALASAGSGNPEHV